MGFTAPPVASTYAAPGTTLGGFNFTSDGTYIYGGQLAGATRDIFRFDPTGPTSTKIYANADTTEYLNTAQPVVFNGGLYIACSDASNLVIYKWDGTPNNWTAVFTLAVPANTDETTWCLTLTQDILIAVAGASASLGDNTGVVIRYSSDGVVWNTGTWDGGALAASPTISNTTAVYLKNGSGRYIADGIAESNMDTLYVVARYDDGSETPFLAKWNVDRFTTVSAVSDGADSIWCGQGLYWKYDDSANQLQWRDTEITDFDAGWTTVAGNCGIDAPSYLPSVGIYWDIGYLQDGSDNLKVYYWDRNTNAWMVGETVINSASASSAAIYVRLNDNTVIVQRSTSGTNYSSSQRADDLDAPPVVNDTATGWRLIDIAVDDTNIYFALNEDQTLKLQTYDLATLTEQDSIDLGTSTFVELDDRTRGIYLAMNSDNSLLFVRGRDGNDVQLQTSADQGATLDDISGSGWAGKYAAGLGIDPLNEDDILITFADDDIYQSTDGGDSWSKIADAPVVLRETNRHPINRKNVILAGQAGGAGDLFFSPNLGATTEDTSDAYLDIINHIEVSL
jgi:hypothetical protein